MLCITMRRGEYFTVDGDTVILVDQLSGERAHLTIHAPRDVAIVRGAVLERSGNPPPACLAELSARKRAKYRPEAVFRWNSEREKAVRRALGMDWNKAKGVRRPAAPPRRQPPGSGAKGSGQNRALLWVAVIVGFFSFVLPLLAALLDLLFPF